MLELTWRLPESFDESTSTFIPGDSRSLRLEHSLVSLSKWEAKWGKPFLGDNTHTNDQTFDYIRCMDLDGVSGDVFNDLTQSELDRIAEYINDKQSATFFAELPGSTPQSKKIVTSEMIYHWMVSLTIPVSCETWHLNRLLTLIRIQNEKNSPQKKMSKSERVSQMATLNAQRRAQMGTDG